MSRQITAWNFSSATYFVFKKTSRWIFLIQKNRQLKGGLACTNSDWEFYVFADSVAYQYLSKIGQNQNEKGLKTLVHMSHTQIFVILYIEKI